LLNAQELTMLARLTLFLTVLALPLAANAAGDSNNPEARYRHQVMETIGNNFSAMAQVFTGKVDRPGNLQVHARILAETTTLIDGLFPESSRGGHALPLIWEEPDQVRAAAQKSAETAAALADAAAGGDRAELAKAFKAAGDACKGCHERYKEED
jgi:cytochrome c556